MTACLTRASAAALVAIAAVVPTGPAAGARSATVTPCPSLRTVVTAQSIVDVAQGAERVLGRSFARYVDERHTTTIVDISELASLARTDQGLRRWRQLGARRCGQAITAASWLVRFRLPEAKLPSSGPLIAIIALTKRGWRVWYPATR